MPSEPLGVRASAVGSRFVALTWDPPVQRHGAVLAYHIFYKEQDSSRLSLFSLHFAETILNRIKRFSVPVTQLSCSSIHVFFFCSVYDAFDIAKKIN